MNLRMIIIASAATLPTLLCACGHPDQAQCLLANARYKSALDLNGVMVISIMGRLYLYNQSDSSVHRITSLSPEATKVRDEMDSVARMQNWHEYKAIGQLRAYRFSCEAYDAGNIAVVTMTMAKPTEYTRDDYEATLNSPATRGKAEARSNELRQPAVNQSDPPIP